MNIINLYSILCDIVMSFMRPDRGIYQLDFEYSHQIWQRNPVF